MSKKQNKVVHLFPNESYNKIATCDCGRCRTAPTGIPLVKQTIEWNGTSVCVETTFLKSVVKD